MRVDLLDAVEGRWSRGTGAVEGFVTFDHAEVRVELVDVLDEDDHRSVTVKRFPTWGDAGDLIDLIDVQPVGDGAYRGGCRGDWQRPVKTPPRATTR